MRFARRQALVVAALAAVACVAPATAGAAPAHTARAADFCSAGKTFLQSLQTAPTTASIGGQGTTLRTNLTKLQAAKGTLIAAAPNRLKPSVRTVIAAYGTMRADFQKVNWKLSALLTSPATLAQLESTIAKAKPSFARVKAYIHANCGG
jgi:hypothetical protein